MAKTKGKIPGFFSLVKIKKHPDYSECLLILPEIHFIYGYLIL